MRYLPSRKLDTSFGTHGLAPTAGRAAAAAVGNGARDQTDVQATMFIANGTVDSAFDNRPFSYTGARFAGHESPSAVAVPPFGQTSSFGLAGLDANGSLGSGHGRTRRWTAPERVAPDPADRSGDSARRVVEVQAPWIVDQKPHSR